MTKEDFDKDFKMNDLRFIAKEYEQDGIPDRPARREAFNNKLDLFHKEGYITDYQVQNWAISDSLETTKYWI